MPDSAANAAANAAQHLLETAARLEVDYVFTNLGSDHPAFIEAFARARVEGRRLPHILICPHEMTALSAAHGHAMRSGRAQMVLVHVDVGTQNLGCSVHNAARGRVPAIIVAGLSPVTVQDELTGHRTETIHYTQDAPRQHEIVSQYMKWSYELRAGQMAEAVILRALQIAHSAPAGPVYITGAREFWEATPPTHSERPEHWPPSRLGGLNAGQVEVLHEALQRAKRPLVMTTYLGRQPAAVAKLVSAAERFGFGVIEISPQYLSFPGSHPQHLGYRRNIWIDEADFILLLDIDVPWIHAKVQPRADARIFHIDVDAVKSNLGFWHFPAEFNAQADALLALDQILTLPATPPDRLAERLAWVTEARQRKPGPPLPAPPNDALTVAQVTHAVRELIHAKSVVVYEEPTGNETILSILRMSEPGSCYGNGGTGLGWSLGAALGIKLADPEAEVLCLVGDGSYLFGVPSSNYWVSQHYQIPILTIIYNNGGWNAPKASTLLVHPQGVARQNDTYWITMAQGARLAEIAAAAGDAAAFEIRTEDQLLPTLQEALSCVRQGRSAVVEVHITPVSAQVLPQK